MAKIIGFIALLYTVALFVLSLANIKSLPKIELNNIDKLFHATAYCGLVIVWYLYFYVKNKKDFRLLPLLLICVCAVIFGIIIEIIQGNATNYRTEDVFDMLANLSGTLVACLLVLILKKHLKKLKVNF